MSQALPSIVTRLLCAEAGELQTPEMPEHLLTIHASPRIGQEIACEGPLLRRELTRGDIDVIPAGACVRLVDEGSSRVLALVLPRVWTAAAYEDLGLGEPALRPQFSLRDPRLEEIAWRLHRRAQAGRRDLYDDCLADELLRRLHLGQQTGVEAAVRGARPLRGAALRRVLDCVEERLDEPITIQDLALEAGLGPTAFKAAFQAALGAPAHRYLVRRRAERARLLLLAGELPASQVALEAGFSHQSHMARWLRRLFGLLPSDLARLAE